MKPRVVVSNYGVGRNSVLLVNQSIINGIKSAGLLASDGDITFNGVNPDDRFHYAAEAADRFSAYLDTHETPDVLIAQASFARHIFQVAIDRCPNTLRVLQRDSTHAGYRKRILDAEYQRLGISVREPPEITGTELHEYELAHRITTLSRYVTRTFEGEGLGGKVHYVGPQTIDMGRWRVFPREPDGMRYRVMFCGQIVIRKAAHLLCEAWKRINPQEDEELVFVGVVAEPGERADYMTRILRETPRCRWGEWRDIYQMWRTYARTDVYCLPSLEEGSSCTCIEALACGRPLIASDRCGSDLLEDQNHRIGKLVEAGNVDALAEALEFYRHNPAAVRDHGQAARKYAVEAGGMDRYGADFARAVETLWQQWKP